MKNKVYATILAIFLFFLPLPILAAETKLFFLPEYVNTGCLVIKPSPDKVIISLDSHYYNQRGYETGANSCKGETCWSWEHVKEFRIFTSNLPLGFKTIESQAKTLQQTIKKSQNLRLSSTNVAKMIQEFVDSSTSSEKSRGLTKEESITTQKEQKESVETNITPLFHSFLKNGIQGTGFGLDAFCAASAVDLFYQLYERNELQHVIQAFLIFQTLKPEDIRFNAEDTMINRAKFLYSQQDSLFSLNEVAEKDKKKVWAQALLFSALLELKEFEKVRNEIVLAMQNAYKNYVELTEKNTKELSETQKELAAAKFAVDKNLNEKTQQSEIEDAYAAIVAYTKKDEKLKKELEQAIQNNDPLLEKKFVKSELNKNIQKYAIFVVPVAVVAATTAIIIIKKKRKQS